MRTARGVYRNGRIELLDEPEGIDKARVIVTFLDEDDEAPERRVLELLVEKRREILEIAGKYHAGNVRVFGSAARGETEPGSDVDFLVEMQPGWSPFDLIRLKRELQRILGCPVDVIRESALSSSARKRVCREAVPV